MKIAFAGKGGSGKTTLSSLFTRHLAALGLPVVAIDADINQHLADAPSEGHLPAHVLLVRPAPSWPPASMLPIAGSGSTDEEIDIARQGRDQFGYR